MTVINLREFYPELYKEDQMLEVPNEVYETLKRSKKDEDAYERRMYRNKAQYSLDRNDGIEREILYPVLTPGEIYERKQMNEVLYAAIAKLPDKQAKRVYAHFLLGMSVADIAKAEGVSQNKIYVSLKRGVRNLARTIEKNL